MRKKYPYIPARTSKIPFNRVWEGSQRPLEQSDVSYFVPFDVCKPLLLRIEVPERRSEAWKFVRMNSVFPMRKVLRKTAESSR